MNDNTPDESLLKRCGLYLQKAPRYLQEIASSYDRNIYVFINWDVEIPTCYKFAVIPDENDSITDIYAIHINPYSLALKKDDLECRILNTKIDLRDVIVFGLLHEIGHIQNSKKDKANDEALAWEWAKREYSKIKNRLPHKNRLTPTIENQFDLKLVKHLIENEII